MAYFAQNGGICFPISSPVRPRPEPRNSLVLEFLLPPELSLWGFLGFTTLSFFTSAFGVAAGLGGGVMLIAVMANVFPPAVLIPVHGVIQFGTNVSRSILMRRDVAWQLFPAFALGALAGGFLGGQLVVALPKALLQIILGAFVLYVCWAPKPPTGKAYSGLKFFLFGCAGALLSMFVGATGTILAPFVRAACRDRHEYVATHAVLMTVVHGLKGVVFGILGFAFHEYLPLMAAMIGTAVLGNLFGRSVLRRLPEKVFTRIFQVVLTILSLRLLYVGFADSGYL